MLQIKKLSSFADLASFENLPVPFFQTPQYLQIFSNNFCKTEDLILLGVGDGPSHDLIGYGAFEKIDDKIVFLGMKRVLNNQELTDYGDIWIKDSSEEKYAQAWEEILKWFKENRYKTVELDYVREDSETYKFFHVRENIKIEPQQVAPYIMLPKSWEEYVSSLEYHNRRELRRKMNRLEKDFSGKYQFISAEISEKSFAEFIRLVKLAEDEKEKFMTREMEGFFWELVIPAQAGILNNKLTDRGIDSGLRRNDIRGNWHPFLNFLEIEGKPVAAILTFENGAESLAYNSGYDPAYKFYSAGLLVHAFKIRDLIERKKPAFAQVFGEARYDFLRGSERYKFDLGGKRLQLYKIGINLL